MTQTNSSTTPRHKSKMFALSLSAVTVVALWLPVVAEAGFRFP
jgi:hypothetical protein